MKLVRRVDKVEEVEMGEKRRRIKGERGTGGGKDILNPICPNTSADETRGSQHDTTLPISLIVC